MSRTLSTILLVSFLIASQAALDTTKVIKFAEKPVDAGWRQGGACWLRDGTLAVTLVMIPTGSQTNINLLTSFYNADFTATKAETTKELSNLKAELDDIRDASIVCLGTGGFAFNIQFKTAVSVYFFDQDGVYINSVTRTAYGSGRTYISPTPDGGFLLSNIEQTGAKNSIELYQADATLRTTIDLSSTSSTTKTAVGLGVGGILVGLYDGAAITFRRYENDGTVASSDITFTEDWSVEKMGLAQLANGNYVMTTFGNDANQLRISKARIIGASGTVIATESVSGAEIDKYNLGALNGGDWVWGYSAKDSSDNYADATFRIYKNDGTAKSDAFLLASDSKGGFIFPRMDGTVNVVWYTSTTSYQQLFMARFDAERNQLGFNDACTTCPVLETPGYVNASITFATTLEDFKAGNGIAKLYAILVDTLHVGADQIYIIKLSSGSTIVDFQIKEDKKTAGAPTITQLQQSLATAVAENKITVLGSTATGYTVKATSTGTTSAGTIQIALFSIIALFVSMLF